MKQHNQQLQQYEPQQEIIRTPAPSTLAGAAKCRIMSKHGMTEQQWAIYDAEVSIGLLTLRTAFPTFDGLYEKSTQGETFERLMGLILCRDNILLAYRNIKRNDGSVTPGTDGLTMRDIEKYTPDALVQKVRNITKNYSPRAVRRKEIPKQGDPSRTRPLGIPCIWDRLIQQCILQVLDPICEAKFSNNSFGFRPNRSCEHAVAAAYKHVQLDHLHYVVEFDIQGFFDNVDHSKLIKQIWALGIRDKKLIYIIKRLLKATIQLEDGTMVTPTKGTPQGGIISPLPITEGWIINDDNLLACSEGHIRKVFEMLSHQPKRPVFAGGLDSRLLRDWHVDLLREAKTERMYFAYDVPEDLEPLIHAGRLLRNGGIKDSSGHKLKCYVLIGYPGDTLANAEKRLLDTWRAGFWPYAMLYHDEKGETAEDWRVFQRVWLRPQIVYHKLREVADRYV